MAQMGSVALDGGDPRLRGGLGVEDKGIAYGLATEGLTDVQIGDILRPQLRKLHDTSVTFEEYAYYAEKTRAEEDSLAQDDGAKVGLLQILFPTKSGGGAGEKIPVSTANSSTAEKRAHISDDEWTNASRALRTASTSAIFYLITTDILGPFGKIKNATSLLHQADDNPQVCHTHSRQWVGGKL
jgi:hypothetical protein